MASNRLLSWAQRPRTWTGLTMLVFAVIFVTPYCGYLFQCGCAWAWAGLDAFCNVHDAAAEHRCPWCASLEAAGASMIGLFGASYLAAVNNFGANPSSFLAGYGGGMSRGLAAFLGAGFITAWLAALYTGYRLFIITALV